MIDFVDVVQGSPEWYQARCGIVTASELHKVLAKGEGKTRAKYMRQLAGEIITGNPSSGFEGNAHTERGKEQEPIARSLLEAMTGKEIREVGFIRNSALRMGCSPDGLMGDQSGVEIKCCLPDIQIERLMKGGIPSEYVAQVEGSILVTGIDSWMFFSFSSGLPAHVVDFKISDERRAAITAELNQFNEELDAMVEKVKGMY